MAGDCPRAPAACKWAVAVQVLPGLPLAPAKLACLAALPRSQRRVSAFCCKPKPSDGRQLELPTPAFLCTALSPSCVYLWIIWLLYFKHVMIATDVAVMSAWIPSTVLHRKVQHVSPVQLWHCLLGCVPRVCASPHGVLQQGCAASSSPLLPRLGQLAAVRGKEKEKPFWRQSSSRFYCKARSGGAVRRNFWSSDKSSQRKWLEVEQPAVGKEASERLAVIPRAAESAHEANAST